MLENMDLMNLIFVVLFREKILVYTMLNTSPFLCIAPNTHETSFAFLVSRALVTLYLDAKSTRVNMFLYVFPSKTVRDT